MNTENTGKKQGGKFRTGQSGNPAGRPRGARNKTTIMAESIIGDKAEQLINKLVSLALDGDVTAIKICMDRLAPPQKERLLSFNMPDIKSPNDVYSASHSVLKAIASGELTLSEGSKLLDLLKQHKVMLNQQKIDETFNLSFM